MSTFLVFANSAALAMVHILARLLALAAGTMLSLVIHEAGHALAGVACGRTPRRVLLGIRGRFRGSFAIGRIPVVVRGWPTGGQTQYRGAMPGARGVWTLLAGPLANLLAALAGWGLDQAVGSSTRFVGGPGSVRFWLSFFVMTNLCAFLRNLMPYQVAAGAQVMSSDGWQLMTRFQSRPSLSLEKTSRAKAAAPGVLARTVALLSTLLAGAMLVWMLMEQDAPARERYLGFPPPMVILFIPAILQFYGSWKVAKHSFPVRDPAAFIEESFRIELSEAWLGNDWPAAVALFSRKPGAISGPGWQFLEAFAYLANGDFAEALELSRGADDPDRSPAAGEVLSGIQISALSALGKTEEAAALLSSQMSTARGETRQYILDESATFALKIRNQTLAEECLPHLRQFCQANPGIITMRGTLGSILAELGMAEEARPILLQVLKTTDSLEDVGIVSAFLAEIALSQSEKSEARRHATRALRVCDAAWVRERAARAIPGSGRTVSGIH